MVGVVGRIGQAEALILFLCGWSLGIRGLVSLNRWRLACFGLPLENVYKEMIRR